LACKETKFTPAYLGSAECPALDRSGAGRGDA
jgi:hypothetical protein